MYSPRSCIKKYYKITSVSVFVSNCTFIRTIQFNSSYNSLQFWFINSLIKQFIKLLWVVSTMVKLRAHDRVHYIAAKTPALENDSKNIFIKRIF